MTQIEGIVIACRTLAGCLVASAIKALYWVLWDLAPFEPDVSLSDSLSFLKHPPIAGHFAASILLGLAAVPLWRRAQLIAQRLASSPPEALDLERATQIALIAVGVFAILDSLPWAVRTAPGLLAWLDPEYRRWTGLWDLTEPLLPTFVQWAIAAIVILRSRIIAAWTTSHSLKS